MRLLPEGWYMAKVLRRKVSFLGYYMWTEFKFPDGTVLINRSDPGYLPGEDVLVHVRVFPEGDRGANYVLT